MKMATRDECDSTSKRRRTANAPVDINDLTADTLVAVAEFLPKTSRALLAVALMAPSPSWRELGGRGVPSPAGKAIVASSVAPEEDPSGDFISSLWLEASSDGYDREKREIKDERGHTGVPTFKDGIWEQLKEYYDDDQWSILDFADIGNLAARLSDDDIGAVLLCIDAPNKLRRLNLTNCFGLVGHGLGPLRQSIMIEKIDMGLCRQLEKPKIFDDAQLAKEAVYPIIEEILRTEGNSLARLQMPMHWWNEGDRMPEMEKRFLQNHGCLASQSSSSFYFGFDDDPIQLLAHLQRRSGTDVADICPGCADNGDVMICRDCRLILCDECDGLWKCIRCGIKQCEPCRSRSENPVEDCASSECTAEYCTKCMIFACRSGTITCTGCKDRALRELLAENAAQNDEIGRLREIGSRKY